MKPLRARSTRSFVAVVLLALSACKTGTDDRSLEQRDNVDSGNHCTCDATKDDAENNADRKYFIFGDVVSQGEQPFTGDLTIFEAVTKAQPHKDSANLGRVRLIRADPRDPFTMNVDLQHIIETGDSRSNVHVQERDVIYVPAAEPK